MYLPTSLTIGSGLRRICDLNIYGKCTETQPTTLKILLQNLFIQYRFI